MRCGGRPLWLGFNVELKYPTDAEIQSMSTRFYSRNYFTDAVLGVKFPPSFCHSKASPVPAPHVLAGYSALRSLRCLPAVQRLHSRRAT